MELLKVFLFQAFHFPPAFYHHVTNELHKPFILILNKIDLASPELVVAWKHYFKTKYPDLNIVCFTSFPHERTASQDPGAGSVYVCLYEYSSIE